MKDEKIHSPEYAKPTGQVLITIYQFHPVMYKPNAKQTLTLELIIPELLSTTLPAFIHIKVQNTEIVNETMQPKHYNPAQSFSNIPVCLPIIKILKKYLTNDLSYP
ncbi:hypothetical protein [Endozoicomonas sp. ALD040]|uniref:hypothetical protein n=1 Tax=Endozoicomonas sp. ALD040 TaxID=3403079 RepID=UPI003BB11EF9